MGGHAVPARVAWLGRVAGEELGLAAVGDDVQPVRRAVRRAEADAPVFVAAALGADQDEVVETEQASASRTARSAACTGNGYALRPR